LTGQGTVSFSGRTLFPDLVSYIVIGVREDINNSNKDNIRAILMKIGLKLISVIVQELNIWMYRDADKSLARPTSRYILFDGENISFDASLFIYINSTNIPPTMTRNRIYENQNLLSLWLVSFLFGLRTYQHSCTSSLQYFHFDGIRKCSA
jgi:hypothetical protein